MKIDLTNFLYAGKDNHGSPLLTAVISLVACVVVMVIVVAGLVMKVRHRRPTNSVKNEIGIDNLQNAEDSFSMEKSVTRRERAARM